MGGQGRMKGQGCVQGKPFLHLQVRWPPLVDGSRCKGNKVKQSWRHTSVLLIAMRAIFAPRMSMRNSAEGAPRRIPPHTPPNMRTSQPKHSALAIDYFGRVGGGGERGQGEGEGSVHNHLAHTPCLPSRLTHARSTQALSA